MGNKTKLDRWRTALRDVGRFVDGEIEQVSRSTVLRGPIKEARLEGEYVTFLVGWTASSPEGPQRRWKLAPDATRKFRFWLPSDYLSVPQRRGRRISFTLGADIVVLYPKDDRNLLDHNQIVGL